MVAGVFAFLVRRMFRGGCGHLKERRLLSLVSIHDTRLNVSVEGRTVMDL